MERGSRRRRGPWRALQHRLRPVFTRPLVGLGIAVLPRLYLAYLWLVWKTSRIDPGRMPELHDIIREHNGAVGLLWHEEVATVAYGYRSLGFRPHTLARHSNAGRLITRMLELCDFVVFRGGSSRRRSRRRHGVLDDMIEHMRQTDEVIYGLTVDGSNGPPYRIKPGGVQIARACDKPLVLVRTWYKRSLRLDTWDRTAIPLPFNEIRHYMLGPYFVPEDSNTPEGMERFRLRLEDDLVDLAARSYRDMGQRLPERLSKDAANEARLAC